MVEVPRPSSIFVNSFSMWSTGLVAVVMKINLWSSDEILKDIEWKFIPYRLKIQWFNGDLKIRALFIWICLRNKGHKEEVVYLKKQKTKNQSATLTVIFDKMIQRISGVLKSKNQNVKISP